MLEHIRRTGRLLIHYIVALSDNKSSYILDAKVVSLLGILENNINKKNQSKAFFTKPIKIYSQCIVL